jgi:5'-3' exonuclease
VENEAKALERHNMSKFLLVDTNHLFHRAKYSVRGDQSEKIGLCLHILFSSLNKAWRLHKADHIVFAFDGSSWRKKVYAPYKANRAETRVLQSTSELEDNKLFFEAFDIFKQFITERTNCTVLYNPVLESDDTISWFIKSHPHDQHVVVSSDADFEQLLAPNVILYNGVSDSTTSLTGIFDYKGKQVIDKKTGNPKIAPDPEWSVFEKCVRGCTTDNIFSAYPGIREKGSKKKTGLREAFEDRHKKGFAWNSIMQHHWAAPNGEEHKVLDDYARNMMLVDLSKQPENIQTIILETILSACTPLNRPQIGLFFLKICGRFELQKLSDRANDFVSMLSSKYPIDNE